MNELTDNERFFVMRVLNDAVTRSKYGYTDEYQQALKSGTLKIRNSSLETLSPCLNQVQWDLIQGALHDALDIDQEDCVSYILEQGSESLHYVGDKTAAYEHSKSMVLSRPDMQTVIDVLEESYENCQEDDGATEKQETIDDISTELRRWLDE